MRVRSLIDEGEGLAVVARSLECRTLRIGDTIELVHPDGKVSAHGDIELRFFVLAYETTLTTVRGSAIELVSPTD